MKNQSILTDLNLVEQETEMEGRDYFILFKERERIKTVAKYYYEGPIEDGDEKPFWYVTRSRDKNGVPLPGGASVIVSGRFPGRLSTGWDVDLPGIHLVSRRDFEAICKAVAYRNANGMAIDALLSISKNLNITGTIKILSREKKNVTERAFWVINGAIDRFTSDGGWSITKVEFVQKENLFRLKNGRKVAYLPAGYATDAILSCGQNLPNLAQARIMAKASRKNERFDLGDR